MVLSLLSVRRGGESKTMGREEGEEKQLYSTFLVTSIRVDGIPWKTLWRKEGQRVSGFF